MKRKTVVKLALTIMTTYFAVVPMLADVSDSHLFNSEWPPHSKVHLVWFLMFTGLIAGISIFLLWFKDELLAPSLIGLSFNFSFVVAFYAAPFYGGVEEGHAVSLTDIPPNLAENVALGLGFLGIAIYLQMRRQKEDTDGSSAHT